MSTSREVLDPLTVLMGHKLLTGLNSDDVPPSGQVMALEAPAQAAPT